MYFLKNDLGLNWMELEGFEAIGVVTGLLDGISEFNGDQMLVEFIHF